MIKISYIYNPDTKEYLGIINAFIDPVRSNVEQKEIYLLPLNATFTPPPEIESNQGLKINEDGTEWEVVEDYSKATLWDKKTAQPAFLAFMEKLPQSLTTHEPLEKKEGFDNVFNEDIDKWELKPDFRGQLFFKKETGEPVVIDEVGDIPDNLTDKVKPSEFYMWSEGAYDWILDESLKQNFITAQNINQKEKLRVEAEDRITLLERKVKLKRATNNDLSTLNLLYGFTLDLEGLNLEQEEVSWIELPK